MTLIESGEIDEKTCSAWRGKKKALDLEQARKLLDVGRVASRQARATKGAGGNGRVVLKYCLERAEWRRTRSRATNGPARRRRAGIAWTVLARVHFFGGTGVANMLTFFF